MSTLYTLNITLDAQFSEHYIEKVLERGVQLGFLYHDLEDTILTSREGSKHIIKNVGSEENTPHIYVNSSLIGSFFIGFYKNEDDQLELSIGDFGTPIKRDFLYSFYAFDWSYYIIFFLPLVKDFAIVKLETEVT